MKLSVVISGLTFSATAALAQPAPPPGPPPPPRAIAPDTNRDGVIQQAFVNPRGDIDGVLLRDGTAVRFPPHAVVAAAHLKAGTAVHVSGVKGRDQTLFDARITAGSTVIADPQLPPPQRAPDAEPRLVQLTANGRVARLLTNPEGLADAALLEDGTLLHVGPELARAGVVVGAQVKATGLGGSYPAGRSIDVETLAVGSNAAIAIDHPRPPAP